jgi:hypothetical protein
MASSFADVQIAGRIDLSGVPPADDLPDASTTGSQ